MLHRGVSPVRTLIWTVIAYGVCELNTLTRTQSFAYPLFVLTLILILDDDRERRFGKRMLLLPIIFLLWANLHGSVLLAAPIAIVYCVWAAAHNRRAAQRRSMTCYLMLALCLPLAIVTTPYGLTIIDYYRSVLANPVLTARVSEWQPATFSGVSTQFVIVLLATVGCDRLRLRPRLQAAADDGRDHLHAGRGRRARGPLPGVVRVRRHASWSPT